MDLLRWWRFLWALDIDWNRATRADARDFIRWMQIANKPQRLHWRHRRASHSEATAPKPRTPRKKLPGTPNAPARGPAIALARTEVAMKSSQLYRPALREGARAVTVMRGMKIGS
ncbi:hypothetical protein [Streptomyces sp. NPDC059378]|uniref:hypothetical protein n=1 Tax=Streptomyces sp. NPDC059378 TaxID=3346815 RepID=UPI0036901E8F